MTIKSGDCLCRASVAVTSRRVRIIRNALLAMAAGGLNLWQAAANPSGGTVSQGTATFNSSGQNLTITTSQNAFINWQNFDINAGETTTFVQPSSSSVVWNQINSGAQSQILGNLDANGYVILQNPNGFNVGGSASITAHGLLMTTASPSQTPDLSSGGPWQFNAAPPGVKIINYGTITVDKNSSAFLIADDVENNGTISAPQGNIGLYSGQNVLVSMRPDGRGLSAHVTLPAGSVDNTGKLVADGGSIVMQAAKVVNQGGTVQANAAANVNGVIELLASQSLTIGAGSTISATGDATAGTPSPGGFVVLNSGGTYSDTATSTIDVSGANGGQSGFLEVFGTGATPGSPLSVLSTINNPVPSQILYNPGTIALSSTTDSKADVTLDPTFLANYGQIALFATQDIKLEQSWSLTDPGAAAALTLSAGNNINLNNGATLAGANNWEVNLNAGNGVYLNGTATLKTVNDDIDIYAGNTVQVGWSGKAAAVGAANSGTGSIFTTGGGSISVTAVSGDVNTGSNPNGYIFAKGNYRVGSTLGGISTAAGGNVDISAGGNVVSYLPAAGGASSTFTAGAGAYGTAQPGNVTITAGGSVYGNYVEANGAGSITAENGNVGSLILPGQNDPNPNDVNSTFALNLVKGSWDIEAPNGSIYLQEARNPNGDFNGNTGKLLNLFDYDPLASLSLNAPNGAVMITGGSAMPRLSGLAVPIVLPPSLEVTAGSGGFTLFSSVTLFQSPEGNVNITTLNGGDFNSGFANTPPPSNFQLFMSDSPSAQWNQSLNPLQAVGGNGPQHASTPPELNNPNPVEINVSGSINNVDIYTTKATEITVGGNMKNSSFLGENLHPNDVSSVNVAGQIYYSPYYSFQTLGQAINPIPFGADDLNSTPTWQTIFSLLVDPYIAQNLVIPADATPADLANYASYLAGLAAAQFQNSPNGNSIWAFNGGGSAGFTYNSSNLHLGYGGPMSSTVKDWLNGWNGTTDSSGNKVFNTTTVNGVTYGQLYVIRFDPTTGLPVVQNGHLQLDPVTFVDQNSLNALYAASLHTVTSSEPGIQIGGPGKLLVNAGSLSMGDSQGIDSWGIVGPDVNEQAFVDNYVNLGSLTGTGASINITVAGNIDMLTSRIASTYGGDVTVTAGGTMDLGTTEVPPGLNAYAYGIYTTGGGNVKVTASGDINIDGSRIATFNGGDIFVESENGNVNVGNGGNSLVSVPLVSSVKLPNYNQVGDQGSSYMLQNGYDVFGSGIVATSLPKEFDVSGTAVLPGNITVETPKGNISSSQAGILQYALDGSTTGGPTITLVAGTAAVTDGKGNIITPAIPGTIDLGHAGIIGGTVNLTAQGNIAGVIISRQNSTIDTSGNFSGTLLSGGVASVGAGGSVSGTVIGIGGVNASAGGGVSAALLGQNVSVNGGASQSTLGTSAAASASSQNASGEASDSSKQQVASNGDGDDDGKKKKGGQGPALTRRSSRVTVIVPKGT